MGVLPLESVAETVDDSLGGEGAAETLLADDQVDGEGDLGVGRGTLRVKARMVLTSRMGLRCG